ncbi:MAG TPA: ABC transporter ATP-binding protein [Firmicutes bacterium]|nr:ABC transporter ATP-binding protein [Bacillota bacterium]
MNPIVTDRLSKIFKKKPAVDELTLEVDHGSIFGFLGPNGAGKSTTIRMLCGILKQTSGSAYVGGFSIDKESEKIKSIIGYMSQRFSLYDDLTVRENLKFYSQLYGLSRRQISESIELILDRMKIREYRDYLSRNLSGGLRQRLALGCALSHDPEIIFLDEPTSGVDPVTRKEFWDLIRDIAGSGKTFFITTHYIEEAEKCDKLGFMFSGKLIALGSPSELRQNGESLESVFVKLMKDYV